MKNFKRIIAQCILFNTIDNVVKSHNLGGYKANMNAYIMASLSLLSSGNLDLSYIWEHQKVQNEVIDRINELVPIVWSHLTEGVNGLQSSNAREWSKKTECWNKLKLRLADLEKFGDDLLQKETNEDGSLGLPIVPTIILRA